MRVSTVEQNTVRQLDGIELDRVFTDHMSGATRNRPALEDLRRYVREGDTVVVHSMDRLARNLDDLRALVREFTDAGIAVEFVREHMTFTGKDSPMQQLMLSLLGAVAEFERALIRERQREGIELAKKRGVYKGRRPSLTAEQVAELRPRPLPGCPRPSWPASTGSTATRCTGTWLRTEREQVPAGKSSAPQRGSTFAGSSGSRRSLRRRARHGPARVGGPRRRRASGSSGPATPTARP